MLRKITSWVTGLSRAGKIILVLGVIFGLVGVVGTTSNPKPDKIELASEETNQQVAEERASPETETRTIIETVEIPFESKTISDPNLEKGTTEIETTGVNGLKTLTYEQTFTDGVAEEKVLIKEEITSQPITQVTAVGTKVVVSTPKPACDPNYSGACVPIASDVDCTGGSGNGPSYVDGPVYVTGFDIYGLDRDSDGVGCE